MKPIEQRLRCLGIFHGERAFIGPSLMQIDLTNDCNNDCIGCWCNSPLLEERRLTPAEKNVHISFPVVKQLIDDAAAMKTKEVYLAGGGEPFMYRDIMEVIRYIKRRGMCLYINTNFTLLDVPRIHELIGLGVEHLTVSIWAGTPSVYCKTHPNKDAATFIRLENMLKYLQSLKPFHQSPYVKIYNVISNLNYHELDYMYDFALRTKSHSVEFTVIDTIPGKTDVLMLNKQQMSELRAAAVKLKQRVEQLRLDGQTPPILFRYEQFLRRISDSDCVEGNYDKNIINRIPCSVGWNFTRVVPNGDVNGCLKAHRIPVGNINTDSFKNIWNSPAQRYFRKKTYTLEKKDRFFSMIGNDPRAAVGCFKGCDDLGRNEFLDRAVKKLSIIEKNLLKGIAQLCRFIDYLRNKKFIKGKKYEINTFPARALREKSFEPEQDLELRGIAHGYRAYKGPTHVVVDLTNRCNNTCLGCWMYSPLLEEKKVISSWAKAELSERDVIRLIKDLKDMGTEIIRFTGGGEPLLHKSFSKIVRFAKKSGLKVAVTTSLPYVHRSVIEALLLSDELAISLWAANADVYQLMHPNQSKKHFKWIEDTLRSIQTTANRYQEITLCHVLTNKNYKNVNEMITFAQKIGIRRLYFTLIDPIEGKTDTLLLNDNQRQWLYAYLQSVNGEQLNGVIIENYNGLIERLREAGNVQHGNYDGRVIDSLPCYIGWHFSRIVANGDVVPCCRGVKKRIGNIKEKRFKWIWNSLSQQEFRNNALRLSKFDPYFEKIECYKTCDNLMQNKVIHQRWISRAK